MSSKINIRDFLLKLGFDGKEVEKGLKELEKPLKKFQKKLVGVSKTQAKASKAQTRAAKIQDAALKKQNATLAKQTSLKKVIDKLDAKGAKGLGGLRNSARGSNPVKLESARVKAVEQLRVLEKGIADQKVRGARAAERVAKVEAKVMPKKGNKSFEGQRESFARGASRTASKLPSTEQTIGGAKIDPKFKSEIASIRAEYKKLAAAARTVGDRNGLRKLSDDMKDLNVRTQTAVRKNKKLTKGFVAQKFAVDSLKSSLTNMSRSYISLFAIAGAGIGTISLGQELIALKASLLGASGSAVQAASDLAFIKETSMHLGNSLTESTSGFAKMGTAARAAGLGTNEAREMFMAASEASAAFNLSGAESQGVFRAFSQILSKGKLSTEELLQLGERIPIAFTAAAEALGVSTEKLFKQIESGKIRSVEFLPDFSKAMRRYINDSGQLIESLKTSRVALGRFKTSFSLNVMDAFEAGADEGLAEFFTALSDGMAKLNPLFKLIGKAFGFMMKIGAAAIRLFSFIATPFQIVARVLDDISSGMDEPLHKMGMLKGAVWLVYEAFGMLKDGILFTFFALDAVLEGIYAKMEAPIGVKINVENPDVLDKIMASSPAELIQASLRKMSEVGPWGNTIKTFRTISEAGAAQAQSSTQVTNHNTFQVEATDPEKVGESIKDAFDKEMDNMVNASFATGF